MNGENDQMNSFLSDMDFREKNFDRMDQIVSGINNNQEISEEENRKFFNEYCQVFISNNFLNIQV